MTRAAVALRQVELPASPAATEEPAGPGTGSARLPGLATRPGPPAEMPRPPADPAQRKIWLKTALDDALAAPSLSKSKIGMLVAESDSGKTVYARGEKTALNAASNVKIVTSAAALALLGPEYRWRTTVTAAA